MARSVAALVLLQALGLGLASCASPGECERSEVEESLLVQTRHLQSAHLSVQGAGPEAGSNQKMCPGEEKLWPTEDGFCFQSPSRCPLPSSGNSSSCDCCAFCVVHGVFRPACPEHTPEPVVREMKAMRSPRLAAAPPLGGAGAEAGWEQVTVSVASGSPPRQISKVSLGKTSGKAHKVFKDTSGRELLFKGNNVVVKGPPYHPSRGEFNELHSLVAEDFQNLRMLGFNMIRLGVMWAGAEPTAGQYNESYYQVIKDIVVEAAHYGIYVLADMHQDAFAAKYCGEGFPDYVAVGTGDYDFPQPYIATTNNPFDSNAGMRSVFSVDADGEASRESCTFVGAGIVGGGWAASQFSFDNAASYDALYTNKGGLRDMWAAFWAKTAGELKGMPNILGLELINEPFNGNFWGNPLLAIPQVAESQRLLPAYDALVDAIRKVDTEVLIVFDEVTGHLIGDIDGFSRPPGGKDEAGRSVLGFHYYRSVQKVDADQWLDAHLWNAKRLGTGVLMTESCCSQFTEYEEAAFARGESSTQWEYKAFCNESKATDPETGRSWYTTEGFGSCTNGINAGGPYPNPDQWSPDVQVSHGQVVEWGRANTRPHPVAVQGTNLGSWWNSTSHVFEAHIQYDPEVVAPTEIFVNEEMYFPAECGGFSAHLQQEQEAQETKADAKLEYYPAPYYRLLLHLTGGSAQLMKLRLAPKSSC